MIISPPLSTGVTPCVKHGIAVSTTFSRTGRSATGNDKKISRTPMSIPSATLPTLRDCALAALARKLEPSDDNTQHEFRILRRAWQTVEACHPDWLTGARACLETPAPGDVPLVQLARDLNLSLLEQLAVAL